MWCASKVEKIKRANNLKAYKDMIAYMENREIPYVDEKKRKKRVPLESSFCIFMSAIISAIFVIIFLTYRLGLHPPPPTVRKMNFALLG